MTPQELADLHAVCFDRPRPWRAQEFSDLLASKQVFLICHTDGFAFGRIAGPEVELLTLAVHPDARRQGIGADLVAKFEVAARAKNAEQAFLEVAETNLSAINLYRKQGYSEAGYRRDYYADPTGQKITALVMSHSLKDG